MTEFSPPVGKRSGSTMTSRVASQIREHNWFAVVIEFVIVVAGILIAVQINDWVAARDRAAEGQAVTVDLLDEANEIVAALAERNARMDTMNQLRDKAVAALFKGNAGDLSESDLVFGLQSMGVYPSLQVPRHVYDSLVGSGKTELIADKKARAAVAEYYSEVEFFNGQLNYWRSVLSTQAPTDYPGLRTVYDPSLPERQRTEIDLKLLSANPAFKSRFVDLLQMQLRFHMFRVRLLEHAKEMCRALSVAAGKPCDALKGLPAGPK